MNINDHRDELVMTLCAHKIGERKTPCKFCLNYYGGIVDNLLASPALARLLAAARDEARAEAWDEGALKRAQTDPACTVRNLNPYRGGTR